MQKLVVLSLHTSPLAQPGTGDGGGMNVYVRELVSALAQAGVECRAYTRRWDDRLPERVQIEPGFEVVHVPAGPTDQPKEELSSHVGEFTDWVASDIEGWGANAIHANYWLSGVSGLQLKQKLNLPLITTFHTLARVKAVSGDHEPESRAKAEAAVMACADVVLANCLAEADQLEEFYFAPRERIEIVPPGVDQAFFSPGSQAGARQAIGAGSNPLLLFVGRIQPLKGLDVAVGALAASEHTDTELWVIGGASGQQGQAELARINALIEQLDVGDRVRFVDPQPHHLLSTFYRAADISLVPSRSESFGLVALEASACGTPVIASAVGGLLTLVDSGVTGFLMEERDPDRWAAHIDLLLDDPLLARRMSISAAARARTYTWSTSAGRLRRIYADVSSRELHPCV
ncbi:MAG: glycosyltransferase [Acidimicrobiales bacterium]|nr:glycosyltransferase [Acidimicrobiales bacterium]